MVLYDANEAAKRLFCHPRVLRRKSYRDKIGLRMVRIGGRIRFRSDDIDALIERNTEGPAEFPKQRQAAKQP